MKNGLMLNAEEIKQKKQKNKNLYWYVLLYINHYFNI